MNKQTAQPNVADLIAVLSMLKEMNFDSNKNVADTAQQLIVVVEESKFDKGLELHEARLGLQQFLNNLLSERTQDNLRRAENVEILDQEAREQLGFSILPLTRIVDPKKGQTIRLNLLKKVRESVSTGVDLTQPHNVLALVRKFEEDARLKELCTEKDVIVEFLLDILFRE